MTYSHPTVPNKVERQGDFVRESYWTAGPIAGYWVPLAWQYVPVKGRC